MSSESQQRGGKAPELPLWAIAGFTDTHGNIKCNVCGKLQSPSFKECIYCCAHDELDFTEERCGTDEGGGWELKVECARCGKNFDFTRYNLIRDYKAVRRSPTA